MIWTNLAMEDGMAEFCKRVKQGSQWRNDDEKNFKLMIFDAFHFMDEFGHKPRGPSLSRLLLGNAKVDLVYLLFKSSSWHSTHLGLKQSLWNHFETKKNCRNGLLAAALLFMLFIRSSQSRQSSRGLSVKRLWTFEALRSNWPPALFSAIIKPHFFPRRLQIHKTQEY